MWSQVYSIKSSTWRDFNNFLCLYTCETFLPSDKNEVGFSLCTSQCTCRKEFKVIYCLLFNSEKNKYFHCIQNFDSVASHLELAILSRKFRTTEHAQ